MAADRVARHENQSDQQSAKHDRSDANDDDLSPQGEIIRSGFGRKQNEVG
jgi:hypothetical protein